MALQQQLQASERLEGASSLDRMRPSTVGRLPSRGGGGGRVAASFSGGNSFSGGDYGRRRPTTVPTQPLSLSRHSSLPLFPPQSPLFEGEAEAAAPFELLPGLYHMVTDPGYCTPPDPGVADSRPLSPDAADLHVAAAERATAATGPPPAVAAATSTAAAAATSTAAAAATSTAATGTAATDTAATGTAAAVAGPVAVLATGSAGGEAAAAAVARTEAEAALLSEAERASLMGHVALGRGIAASHRVADAEENLLGEIEEIVAMAEHALTARRKQVLTERRVAPPMPPHAAAAAPADDAPELLPRAHDLDDAPPTAPPLPVAGEVSALEAALHARAKATAEHGTEREAEAVPWIPPGARSPLLARRVEEAMWLASEAERLASDHGMEDAEFERRLLELYPALEQHQVRVRQRRSLAAQGGEGEAETETEGGGVVARGGEPREQLIIHGASAVGPRGGGGGGGGGGVSGGGSPPLSRCGTPGQGERHRASTERPAEPEAALEVGLGAAAVTCEARGDAFRMPPASRPASRDAARVATPAMRAPRSPPRTPPSDQRGVKQGGLACEAEALTAHSALPPTTSEGRGARRGGAAAAAHRPAVAAAHRPAATSAAARVGGEMEERAQSLQALQALLIDIESEADSGNAVERSDARLASRERSFSREVAWTPPGSAEMAGFFVAPEDI